MKGNDGMNGDSRYSLTCKIFIANETNNKAAAACIFETTAPFLILR